MKVYSIYSGQPKRFGMTMSHQLCVLSSIVPPLWIGNLWLLLPAVPFGWLLGKFISNEEAYYLQRIKSWLAPSYLRGQFIRHTFTRKVK